MKYSIFFIAAFVTLSCSHADHDTHEHEEPAGEISRSESIVLNEAQMKRFLVSYTNPEQRVFRKSVVAHGQIQTPPGDAMIVNSPYSGRVIEIFSYLPDKKLAKNSPLLRIESAEFESDIAQFHSLESRKEQLEKEVQRQEVFKRENVGSEQSLQRAKADLAEIISQQNAISARLSKIGMTAKEIPTNPSKGFTLKTNFESRIVTMNTLRGASVSSKDTLFTLRTETHYHADVLVHENDLRFVALGIKAEIKLPSLGENYLPAEVIATASQIEEGTRSGSVHLHAIDDFPESVRAGMFVTAKIHISETPLWSVPNSSVVMDEDHAYIFVLDNESGTETTFRPVEIRNFQPELPFAEVDSVYIDKKIVSKGAFLLFAEWTKNEHGDHH